MRDDGKCNEKYNPEYQNIGKDNADGTIEIDSVAGWRRKQPAKERLWPVKSLLNRKSDAEQKVTPTARPRHRENMRRQHYAKYCEQGERGNAICQ
jgi:hypothetical protein